MLRRLRPLLKTFNGQDLTDFKALFEAGAVGLLMTVFHLKVVKLSRKP